jgi:enoyl-CoA hydratase
VIGSPILSEDELGRLARSLTSAAEAARPQPLILRSTHPEVFAAGAHLGEIAALTAASSRDYAQVGRRVLELLHRHPAPTAAAVCGVCAGGGFDLVSRCDLITASPEARFQHPGIRRGLVTGWGGTVTLRRDPDGLLRRVLLTGRPVDADALARAGFLVRVDPSPVAAASAETVRLSTLHEHRLALWRSLRERYFVDIFRTFVVHTTG